MTDDFQIDADGHIVVISEDEMKRWLIHQMQLAILTSIDIKLAEARKPEYGMPLESDEQLKKRFAEYLTGRARAAALAGTFKDPRT